MKGKNAMKKSEYDHAWIDETLTSVAVNLWSPEWYADSIISFDAKSIAQTFADAGIQALYMWQGFTQDHFGLSYFPTRKGVVHKNLAVGRDHAKETIEALHEKDIKVIGYYSYPDYEAWAANPDWQQKDAQGESVSERHAWYVRFGGLCPNSPYREYVIDRVMELVKTYDFDAFYLPDSMQFVDEPIGCYCEYCQRKYREQKGKRLPVYDGQYSPAWQEFLQWRYDCISEIYREIALMIRRESPSTAITHFAFTLDRNIAMNGSDHEEIAELDDVVTSIAAWSGSVGGERTRRHTGMVWKTGLLTNYTAGMSGKPVHMHFGLYSYDREYYAIPKHEMLLGSLSVLMNGGYPSIADNFYPEGTVNTTAYRRLKEVNEELHAHADVWLGTRRLDDVAIYYSKQSRDFYETIEPKEPRYLSCIEGAFLAALKEHVPVSFLSSRKLTLERMRKFKLIILPSAICMSDDEVELFKSYVQEGGAVIVTDQSSMLDGRGAQRRDFGLKEVIGTTFESLLNYKKSFVTFEKEGILTPHPDMDEPVMLWYPQVRTIPEEAETACGSIVYPLTEIRAPHRHLTWASDISAGAVSPYPASVCSQFGKGRSVYFSFDLFRVYGEYGYPILAHMFREAVSWALQGDMLIETDAPKNIEISVAGKAGDGPQPLFVRMLNYTVDDAMCVWQDLGGSFGAGPIPCGAFSVALKCSGRPVRVFAVKAGTEIPFSLDDGRITFEVPGVETYEVLRIEY